MSVFLTSIDLAPCISESPGEERVASLLQPPSLTRRLEEAPDGIPDGRVLELVAGGQGLLGQHLLPVQHDLGPFSEQRLRAALASGLVERGKGRGRNYQPRTLRTKSGTGTQLGRPIWSPRALHISDMRTGFGAVPFRTPE